MLGKNLLPLLLGTLLASAQCRVYETEDAVVIEAEDSPPQTREGRQFIAVPYPVPVPVFVSSTAEQTGNKVSSSSENSDKSSNSNKRACWDIDGAVGQCETVQACYPYVKLPSLSDLEAVILGTKARCSYLEKSGRQVYGVCCARKKSSSPTLANQNQLAPAEVPNFPWWPFGGSLVKDSQQPSAVSVDKQQEITWPETSDSNVNGTRQLGAGCGAGPYSLPSTDEEKRIVGGYAAQPGAWPFMVGMLNGNRQFCGGSLIDSTHVLTAAHCIAHMSSWDVARLRVKLSTHNIKQDGPTTITQRIRRVTRHKNFDSRTLYNDIAILTMESPVSFGPNVSPVCLPNGANLYTGREAVVIGWGSLSNGGRQPDVLQQVSVTVKTNEECKRGYGTDAPGGIIDTFLCASSPGKDSCSGDSGGPLILQNSLGGPWTQVGIVSWGIGCAQDPYPGVYTRVTSFMDWIQKNLQ